MMVWFGSAGKEWMAVVIVGSNNKAGVISLEEGCCTWTRPRGAFLSLIHRGDSRLLLSVQDRLFAIVSWKLKRRTGGETS